MNDAEHRTPTEGAPMEVLPPEAWPPAHRLVRRIVAPVLRFTAIEAASGIALIAATAVALLCANSPWAPSYAAIWEFEVGLQLGDIALVRPLGWIVNDILMAVFFFVIGLEIRRELAFGALDTRQKATLPAAAALGGMLVPAAIFAVLTDGAARAGWGVPMATDIAFALGILTLLGPRVPAVLRILLLAVAVLDDLGAILVIAVFYSSGVVWSNLALGAAGLGLIWLLQLAGVRQRAIYSLPAILVWVGAYTGGLHPTIAGVLVGVMTPVRAWGLEPRSPAADLIDRLHPWVAFGIMPVFALANAGVSLTAGGAGGDGVGLAVAAGLVLGKPLGVGLAIAAAVGLGVARLPEGVGPREVLVLGCVAGIGFTMSLFIASLAFTDAALLDATKLGVLVASAIAGTGTLLAGRLLLPARPPAPGDG